MKIIKEIKIIIILEYFVDNIIIRLKYTKQGGKIMNTNEVIQAKSEEIIIRRTTLEEKENSRGQIFKVFVNGKELENIQDFCISIDIFKDRSMTYRTTNIVPIIS